MTLTSFLKFVITYYKKNISIFLSLIVIILISSYLITSYYNKNKIFINYSFADDFNQLNLPNEFNDYVFNYLSNGFISGISKKNIQFKKINNTTIQVDKDFDFSILETSETQFDLSIILTDIKNRKEKILSEFISINEKGNYKNEILELFYLKDIININNFLKFDVYYEKSFKLNKLLFILLCIFSTIFFAPFIFLNLKKILK